MKKRASTRFAVVRQAQLSGSMDHSSPTPQLAALTALAWPRSSLGAQHDELQQDVETFGAHSACEPSLSRYNGRDGWKHGYRPDGNCGERSCGCVPDYTVNADGRGMGSGGCRRKAKRQRTQASLL